MTNTHPQTFDADHQHLLDLVAGNPKYRSLALSPRACWYRLSDRAGDPWEPGIALAWDVQPDFTGAIVESNDGEVLSLPIGRLRFTPPSPRTEPLAAR
jgi:hypothetical protein